MKTKKILAVVMALTITMSMLSGCGTTDTNRSATGSANASSAESKVATAAEMATPEEVIENSMEPITGDSIKDGVYSVTVDSSSSMFNITECELTVKNGEMTAVMTMGGTGYLYVFMGTGEQAVDADESEYIPFKENTDGTHTFTVPVSALDAGIDCTAFSKNKEKWYDRTLVFRTDSLPVDAFVDGVIATPKSLNLADGTYTVGVTLDGGSGRASVESPAELTIKDGKATAKIVWSSPNYDYIKVDDVQYDPIHTEGNAAFEIPVSGFDYKMPVVADTTAMSTPHEIDYTLYFNSSTIEAK